MSFLCLHTQNHAVCSYVRVWANNANDNNSCGHLALLTLQMEHCSLLCDAISSWISTCEVNRTQQWKPAVLEFLTFGLTVIFFMFRYMTTMHFHYIGTGWNYFPPSNSRTVNSCIYSRQFWVNNSFTVNTTAWSLRRNLIHEDTLTRAVSQGGKHSGGALPCWLDNGRVYMEWEGALGPWWLASLWLWGGVGLAGRGTGRWQNFPVEFEGHQHRSLPMHRPPLRQGIWQKTAERRRRGYLKRVIC